ncbi:MAG: hypothetical protein AB1704_14770 [Pseudomonadota bacterium]|uniref:hypothetical protein n=1 Tax=Burkholderiaceae TaxID=119060 RepID=UPI0010F79ACE|nr:hypothetical protein [Burkholderia sp. 4M9327F10]
MKIRFVCVSAAAAFGFVYSASVFSRVVVSYGPAVAVTAPPPVPEPLLSYTTIVVPPPTNYGVTPAANVRYAQPLMAVPR